MKEMNTVIGENIKTTRKKSGLTQIQLAEKINVSQKQISSWEKGDYKPNIETLIKLSDVFNCTLDELVKGQEVKK